MRSYVKISLFLIYFLLLIGCATHPEEVSINDLVKIAVIDDNLEKSDAFTISNVSISGNKLTISCSYSGGCLEHDFKLVGSSAISKSLPPQRSITLIHNNNGDQCKNLIQKTIHFNIDAFAYQKEKGSIIQLNLAGWNESIEFIYP